MKADKELFLLVKLYHSPTRKKSLISKEVSWCKTQFEKYLGYSDRNTGLRKWINNLINMGCLECVGQSSKGFGHLVDVYVVNKNKIDKEIVKNENYKKFYDYYYDNYFMLEAR